MEELQLKEQLDLYNFAFPKLEFAFIYQIAFCHLCKKRAIVFCCYKNFKAASCTKKYCAQCLRNNYDENIEGVISKLRDWNCPYKQNACCCSKCRGNSQNYRPFREGRITQTKEQIKDNNDSSEEKSVIEQNEDLEDQSQSESESSFSETDEDLNIDLNSLISSQTSSKDTNKRSDEMPVLYNNEKFLQQSKGSNQPSINIRAIKTPFIKQVKERIKNIQNIDIIQAGLEFNYYLIQNLLDQQEELDQEEKDSVILQLFLNLKKLGMSADNAISQGRLVNENRLNKIAYDPKNQEELYNITDKEQLLQFLDSELKINIKKKDQVQLSNSQNSHNNKKKGKQLVVVPQQRQDRLLKKRPNNHILQIQDHINTNTYQSQEVERLEIDENFNIIISKSIINFQ